MVADRQIDAEEVKKYYYRSLVNFDLCAQKKLKTGQEEAVMAALVVQFSKRSFKIPNTVLYTTGVKRVA